MKLPKLIDLIGWTGAACFTLCALPQVIHTVNVGNADGLSKAFLVLWAIGEVLSIIYVWNTARHATPVLTNYILNLALLSILLYYRFWA